MPWPFPEGCSYGINRWAFSSDDTFYNMFWAKPRGLFPWMTSGTRVPIIGDAILCESNPFATDPPPDNLAAPDLLSVWPQPGMRIFCVARHGRAVDIVFMDGHAERTPLEDLWKLTWHKDWVPRSVTLPPE